MIRLLRRGCAAREDYVTYHNALLFHNTCFLIYYEACIRVCCLCRIYNSSVAGAATLHHRWLPSSRYFSLPARYSSRILYTPVPSAFTSNRAQVLVVASQEEEFLRLMLAPDAGTNLHAFTYHHIKSDVMLHHSDSMSNLGGRHSGSGRNADSPRSSARMSGTILTVKATGLEGLHLLSNGELGPELPEPEPETEDDNLYSIGKAGSADAEGLTGEIQPESEVSGSPQDAVLQYPSAVPVGQFQLGPHRCSRNGLPSAAPAARHMLGSNYLLAHKNPQRTMDMPRGSCPLPGSRHGLSRSSAGGGVGLHQRTVERAASRAHGTYGANVADALWNEFAGERRMSSYSAYGRPSVPTTGMPDVAGSYHSDRLVKVNVHSRYSVAGESQHS